MIVKMSTDKTVGEVSAALEAAVEANHFGVMHVHNLKEAMMRKGVEFAHEFMIYEICEPRQAKRMLDDNMSVSTMLPCRISIYEEGGRTFPATLKPTSLIALLDTSQPHGVARHIEDAIVKIMKEAALA